MTKRDDFLDSIFDVDTHTDAKAAAHTYKYRAKERRQQRLVGKLGPQRGK